MPTSADIRLREDGFTLIELLVGITISMVVLLAALTSLDAFSSNAAHQTRVTDANGQVRSVMDSTVTDLRGASVILTAQDKDLAYAVPVSSTATRVERLCVASGELYGSKTPDDATPAAPSGACSGTKLATLQSGASTGFTYDSVTPALVKNVGLTVSLTTTQAGKEATSTLRASAARRSAGTLPITGGDIDGACGEAGPTLTLSAGIPGFGDLSVTYAYDGGVSVAIPGGTPWQVPPGITSVVATVTNAAGVTNTIEEDIECE